VVEEVETEVAEVEEEDSAEEEAELQISWIKPKKLEESFQILKLLKSLLTMMMMNK
jgi:hypothetical protein